MCVCTFAEIGLLVQDSFCRHNLPISVYLPCGSGGSVCVLGGGGGGYLIHHTLSQVAIACC